MAPSAWRRSKRRASTTPLAPGLTPVLAPAPASLLVSLLAPLAAPVSAVALALLVGLAPARAQTPAGPEAASGFQPRAAVDARHALIATANPLASAAGARMLARGGHAIDAAIAAQLVLNLVEPQSSGIGGGAFLLHWDARAQRVSSWDGRETAPAAADENLFLDAGGKPLRFMQAVVGGRSVGTPGVVAMLAAAHRRHGKLPWATLFEPAIQLATRGFAVSERLHTLLSQEEALRADPVARRYFYDRAGTPWPVGHVLRNPTFATTLRRIASQGAQAFYQGPIGVAIVAKVKAHPTNPGRLTLADLRAYRARERDPVCAPYRVWLVCGMPPPSSGGIAVAQLLGVLARTRIATLPPVNGVPDAESVHLFAEAGRLAYADRNRYVADTDFVPLPAGLLDADYLDARARLIGPRSMGVAPAGTPRGLQTAYADGLSFDPPGTSHLSVVDRDGNAVAMTSSIEDGFGARQMVAGFLLNNQLTDFSFAPRDSAGPIANRVEPGKRPRSSMAPTLVFETDAGGRPTRLVMSVGSPGGPTIINFVAKTLVGVLDWNMDVQEAIALANFGSRNGPTELERGRLPPERETALVTALRERGHEVRLSDQVSGLQALVRTPTGWRGGADPRREGRVIGQ